jgi:hypothetical protein
MYDKHQALMKCGNLSHDILQSQLLSHVIPLNWLLSHDILSWL